MPDGVGVLGGTGGVGMVAARQLRAWGIGPLRIGARDESRAARFVAAQLSGSGSAAGVDAMDSDSLARFCADCAVVLNCAGPAYQLRDRVARAAYAAGADYVDAAGDDALYQRLAGLDMTGAPRTLVISAGMMPGLTGLLPRWLATQVPADGAALTGYVGGRDRFTVTGAADYLAAGGESGAPLAAWRRGVRVADAVPIPDATPPCFAEPGLAQPYLSTETERLAGALGIAEVRWYHVFPGQQVLAALRRVGTAPPDDPLGAAERLCAAAELDLFGHDAYQLLVVELAGVAGVRTALLRGNGATALTGAMAALTTRAVRYGAVPGGVHHAADVLDPKTSIDLLRATPPVTTLELIAGPARAVDEDVL